MKVTRFEDLEIWQLARELYKFVFKITTEEPFCKDFKIRDQIRASSGYVSDNIAEGFDRVVIKNSYNFYFLRKDLVEKPGTNPIGLLTATIFHKKSLMNFSKEQTQFHVKQPI